MKVAFPLLSIDGLVSQASKAFLSLILYIFNPSQSMMYCDNIISRVLSSGHIIIVNNNDDVNYVHFVSLEK